MSFTYALLATASDAAEAAPATGADPSGGAGDLMVLWGILLIAAALVLFFTELLIPSGGLILLAAVTSFVFGVVLLFQVDTRLGLAGALFTLLALPFLLAFGLKIWPDLPWVKGLMVLTDRQAAQPAEAESDEASDRPAVGMTGEATTELRPIGMCRFGDLRAECLSADGMIEPGDGVRVVAVDGMQIKVKRAAT